MDLSTILSLGQTAAELGLTCSLTVLALFLSYKTLNIADMTTDGAFTLGCAVSALLWPWPVTPGSRWGRPWPPGYAPALSWRCCKQEWA